MDTANTSLAQSAVRGWTPTRRQQFIGALAAGRDVSKACAAVGLSRQAAYVLRRRDPAFARDWQEALQTAHDAQMEAFLAGLPERLLRTLSDLSEACKLEDRRQGEFHPWRARQFLPSTPSTPSTPCQSDFADTPIAGWRA